MTEDRNFRNPRVPATNGTQCGRGAFNIFSDCIVIRMSSFTLLNGTQAF